MKNQWTLLEDRGIGGEPLYQDEQGFVRMELLPDALRQQLPTRGSIEDEPDPTVYAKFFHITSSFYWYVLAFDGEDILYGYVSSPMAEEFGTFSLSELENIGDSTRMVMPIERDLVFTPRPLSEAKKEA